jgi:hypothetical protein
MTSTDPKMYLLTLCPHLSQLLHLQKCLIYSILVLQHPWWKLKRLQKAQKRTLMALGQQLKEISKSICL